VPETFACNDDFWISPENGLILFIEDPGAQEKANLRSANVGFFAPKSFALSELSKRFGHKKTPTVVGVVILVGDVGFEPTTPCL
jgi:hypothetical protein